MENGEWRMDIGYWILDIGQGVKELFFQKNAGSIAHIKNYMYLCAQIRI